MAKRKRNINEDRIERLIKEGRGQGIGKEYKPWLRIQDVPSLGRVTRLNGIKTGRQHDFLSDLERDYFYILEYADVVVDIREQFPLLPQEETIEIAKELGIRHPVDPKTDYPVVVTSDFVVTKYDGDKYMDVVRTIKPKKELIEERTLEKFEIERRYWEKQEIDWGIVTEDEIDKVLAQNISFIHAYYDIDDIDSIKDIENGYLEDMLLEYIRRIISTEESIRHISNQFDQDMLLKAGTGISFFKHLLIRKKIYVDLGVPLNINKKMRVQLSHTRDNEEWAVL